MSADYVQAKVIRVPASLRSRLDALVAARSHGAAVPTRALVRREALVRGLASLEASLPAPGSPGEGTHPVRPEAAGKLGRRPADGPDPMVRQEPFVVPADVPDRLNSASARLREAWPDVRISRSAVEREATFRGLEILEGEERR